MNLNNRKAQQLLKKYLQGDCTPREIELLHQWYDDIDAASVGGPNIISRQPNIQKDVLAESLLSAIHNKIADAPSEAPVRRLQVRMVAAASFIGILLCTGIFFALHNNNASILSASRLARHEETNEGQQARQITLPDGSKVWLNTHSRLSWTDAFGSQQRSVQLEGEGCFDVAKDPAHPFLVSTAAVTTQVLGTSFNIEAYKEEDNIRIALVTGSVQLSAKSVTDGLTGALSQDQSATAIPTTKLMPGQIASLHKGMNVFEVKQGDAAAFTSWTSGGLVFQDLPLADALSRLSKKFGYTIRGDLGARRSNPVTASFNNESFQEILTDILFVNHLTFSMKDSLVIIHK